MFTKVSICVRWCWLKFGLNRTPWFISMNVVLINNTCHCLKYKNVQDLLQRCCGVRPHGNHTVDDYAITRRFPRICSCSRAFSVGVQTSILISVFPLLICVLHPHKVSYTGTNSANRTPLTPTRYKTAKIYLFSSFTSLVYLHSRVD